MGKQVRKDIATCERLLKEYGDKKLSVVIKRLAKAKPPGRRPMSDAEREKMHLDLYAAVKVLQEDTGCNVTKARKLYAKLKGYKSHRRFEELHKGLWVDAEFLWPDEMVARAIADMRIRLREARLVPPRQLQEPDAPPQLQGADVSPQEASVPPPTFKPPANLA